MNRSLRVGIIGCGRMGQTRARSVAQLGATVAALCDTNAGAAQALAAQHPGATLHERPETFDLSALDAVIVSTPPDARGTAEIAALNAGVALLVEKPIGLSYKHIEQIIRAAERSRAVTAVGYHNRYRPSVQQAKRILEQTGTLAASASWVVATYNKPWWPVTEQSGGALNEQATHFVDLARFLIGGVREVHAIRRSGRLRDERVAVSLLFEGGQVGTLLYSCLAATKQIQFTAFTEKGSVHLKSWDLRLEIDEGLCDLARDVDVEADANRDIFDTEMDAFFRAIESGDRSSISADLFEAARTQAVVDAIIRSAATGEAVRL